MPAFSLSFDDVVATVQIAVVRVEIISITECKIYWDNDDVN